MRAPDFWQAEGSSWQAALLAPAGAIHDAVTRWRFARAQPARGAIPVICVGNLTAGGSGKTPAALVIAALLRRNGRKPAFLSRGYGGSEAGPLLVDPARHGAGEVGDEPLLLAAESIAIVARDRVAGLGEAERIGADCLIMDDGLQNPSLEKTLALAVVDGEAGIGNGKVIPAGPLRARLDFQFSLIDALIVVGQGSAGAALALKAHAQKIPVFGARLEALDGEALAGKKVLAFAGIGRPEKFFASLEAAGAEITASRAFGDHHVFSGAECGELLALAERDGALPVTTTKDMARLAGGGAAQKALAEKTQVLSVALRFDDEKAFQALMMERIGAR